MDYPIADNFNRNPKLKPTAKMIGEDGNVFNLLAICRRALRRYPSAFNELWERVQNSGSYEEALRIMMEYVDVE